MSFAETNQRPGTSRRYTHVHGPTIQLCPPKAPERGFSVNIKLQAIKKTPNPPLDHLRDEEGGVTDGWMAGGDGKAPQLQPQLQDKISRGLYRYLLHCSNLINCTLF